MCLDRKIVSFLFVFLLSTEIYALPADSQLPINISADSSFFNYKSGANLYEGDVKITQGTTTLTADRVETRNNAQRKIEKVTSYGLKKPAVYSTLPKEGDKLLIAKAKVITFLPAESKIILEGDVKVTQDENSFQGPIMIYNMKDQTVIAPPTKSGRATITIEPDKLKP